MSEFDPYLKWLGIRDPERPINHYRLLGLEPFENDPEIISMAADRQMLHVRSYQNGPHGRHSQELLNELARARRCLLTPAKKEAYDRQLKSQTSSASDPPVGPVILPVEPSSKSGHSRFPSVTKPESTSAGEVVNVGSASALKGMRSKRDRSNLFLSLFGWITGGLAALGLAAWLIGAGLIGNRNFAKQDSIAGKATDSFETQSHRAPDVVSANEDFAMSNSPGNRPVLSGSDPNSRPREKKVDIPDANKTPVHSAGGLQSLGGYPRASEPAKALLAAVKKAIANERIFEFEMSSSPGGNQIFRFVPREGGLLIGLAVCESSQQTIQTVVPVYLGSTGAFYGRSIGGPIIAPKTIIARPGYAVGEIEVARAASMSGLRLTFMKITPAGLDTSDRYQGSWTGNQSVSGSRMENKTGAPIIGLRGRANRGQAVRALGLVAADLEVAPDLDATASIADPGNKPTGPPGPTQPVPKTNVPSFFPDAETPVTKEEPDPFAVTTPEIAEESRLELPSAKKIRTIQMTVHELYADRFRQAKDVRARRSLGQLLLRDAISTTDSDLRFVMLNQSIGLSESIGDLATAVQAIREMESVFDIDFWKLARESVDGAALNPHKLTSADYKRTLEALIQEALDQEAYEDAAWLVGRAMAIARRAGDMTALEMYLNKRKEVQSLEKLTVINARAIKMLDRKPDDEGANHDRGDYLFVVKDDLEGALDHWALASDQAFRNLVKRHKQLDRSSVDSILASADAWYDAGKSNRSLRDRKCLQRSLKYFEDAAANAEGLKRRRIEQKIHQIREGME